jgi:hypothetical protein
MMNLLSSATAATLGHVPTIHHEELLLPWDRPQPVHGPVLDQCLGPPRPRSARHLIARLAGPIAGRVMARIAKGSRPDRMRKQLVAPLAMVMHPALENPASGAIVLGAAFGYVAGEDAAAS